MSKGLVAVSEATLSEWAAWQDSNIRFVVFDIDMEKLQFNVVSTVEGTSDFKDDFKITQKHLKDATPALIAFRVETKWILIAWIPEDSPVKKKMIFASSRAALKSQLGAPKFDHDFQVSSVAECTFSNYILKFDEQEKEKTLSSVEKLTNEENKDVISQMTLQTEGMKMLNINVDDSAIKGFTAVKNNATQCAVFFYVNEAGDQLTADEPLYQYTASILASKLDSEKPCYIIFHYSHISEETNEKETKTLVVYFCSDDAHPRKKMISASVFKNIGSACAALSIPVAKKLEISLTSEFSDQEIMSALYPKTIVKEQFNRPKGPPRKSARGPVKATTGLKQAENIEFEAIVEKNQAENTESQAIGELKQAENTENIG